MKNLMKNDRRDKIATTFTTTSPKIYCYRFQKDEYEIQNFQFIMAKRVKKFSSKELKFHDFDKCDIIGSIEKFS